MGIAENLLDLINAPTAEEEMGVEHEYYQYEQDQVDYEDQSESKDKLCIGCVFFRKPNACMVVEGIIMAPGGCKLWVDRKSIDDD